MRHLPALVGTRHLPVPVRRFTITPVNTETKPRSRVSTSRHIDHSTGMSDERRCQLIRFVGLSVSDTNRTPDIQRQEQRPSPPPSRGGGWEGGALLVCKDIAPARDGTVRPPDGPGLGAKIDFALIERKKTSVLS